MKRRHNLTANIYTGVVVVLELGRGNSVSRKHYRRFGPGFGAKGIPDHYKIFVHHQFLLAPVAPQGHRTLVAQQLDFAKVNVLEISSIHSSGLQSHFFELRANVISGELKATRAGAAAFQRSSARNS